jgi:hypothetical protein
MAPVSKHQYSYEIESDVETMKEETEQLQEVFLGK